MLENGSDAAVLDHEIEALGALERRLDLRSTDQLGLLRDAANQPFSKEEEESEADQPRSEKRRFNGVSSSLDVNALFRGLNVR